MAKKKQEEIFDTIEENISIEPLENVMGDRYATYAKYVIQDRAIPDVRDGLKPVQRRIIFSMYKSNNLINRPTKKCAHTVGAVMGTYHPHGDSSIYEALARMSQDWKLRYPLIDFQGNNGSIDGDSPAAYRYTESRLAELSNELIRDIEKQTVDMQLNFDDTELEPVVLPARFPNLLLNGTEGIAVAIATEIPPHNLRELIDAVIYRINHKTATIDDLLEFVKGPDFPVGGIVYKSEGLKNIYTTGRGKIEIASKTEIVQQKDLQQIIITEIPYKVVKKDLVFEIDKIIHSKTVAGLIEIRDESDWKGIRIVIDCKKDAKAELLLKYLMNKTSLVSSYSANMVAIVDGRPKTLNLLDYVDAYIAHQVDVVTRKSRYDLDKYTSRLHIVNGLITASLNINEVVEIIRKSKDKADSKLNLEKRFDLSNEQAEAIVTMPLYKLSHTDELILTNEKAQLEKDIDNLKAILEDSNKLSRVIIKDLKGIAEKYGDDRRTSIEDKGEITFIDKRELIAKENVMIAVTRDGYVKRSTIKSYKGSADSLPGIKDGDALVAVGEALTTDYLICFTNFGNYTCVPVHKLTENRWKDEGVHINTFVTLNPGEKFIKAMAIETFRNDLYLGFLTKYGQIKRMSLSNIDSTKHSKPCRCMRTLLTNDEVIGVQLLNGNSDLLILTSNGNGSLFNENELSILQANASGVKSIAGLGKNTCVSLLAFEENEKTKFVGITQKGHTRVMDLTRFNKTDRLGKTSNVLPCFKSDMHEFVSVIKFDSKLETNNIYLLLNNTTLFNYVLDDYHLTEASKYAKKNIDIPSKCEIVNAWDLTLLRITKDIAAQPIVEKAPKEVIIETPIEDVQKEESISEEKPANEAKESFEQMSIFDDIE